jgi:tetratricopeptide (TPR) repeat protein
MALSSGSICDGAVVMWFVEAISAPRSRALFLLAPLFALWAAPAFALTKEAAIENCRMSVGRPIVMACMRGGGGSIEACREKARPQVVACVMAALNAANGRANVAVAVPTEAAPKLEPGTALPAGFIAPPRTISDIAAILDSEKPDPALIEKLKATADARPSGKESRAQLAQFYFDRGNARTQLGRLADAIEDGNKAIEAGRGAIDANLMGRLSQFLALQYLFAGDPRTAFDIYQRELRETNVQGAKGYLFSTNRLIVGILVQMGDVAQAEGYLRHSLTLIQEARTSGLPGWRASYPKFGQNWEAEVEFTRA